MQIRPMTAQDRTTVLALADAFYHSSAVSHPAPAAIMEQTFADAVGQNPHLTGYLIESDGAIAGFAYLTCFYACELAGTVVMIEELFIRDEFRGKGLGQEFLTWLYDRYPDAKRFRLEVERNNRAVHLYERSGFRFIEYGQMAFDRKS